MLDSRSLVLKDVTAVGILSASPGLKGAIDFYSRGEIDPRQLLLQLSDYQSVLMFSQARRLMEQALVQRFR